MAARISSLERSLAKANASIKSGRPVPENSETNEVVEGSSSIRPCTSTSADDASPARKEEGVIQQGSASLYFNEALLSRVVEEEHKAGSSLLTSQTDFPRPFSSPFDACGIISSPYPTQSPSLFLPPKPLAVKLWRIFLNNVEACAASKILHIPTDEIKIYSTIDNPTAASFEDLALSHAVYFAATVSIDSTEAPVVLGRDATGLLFNLKIGFEQALAQGNFLDCPTVTTLQALAIYLSALRVHNRGTGIWILNGLAIRAAQSLGIHRDGEQLGLSPFQSEIRRRLWWHLLGRDGRAGEDCGLESVGGQSPASNIKLPLNIDDGAIHAEMVQLPSAKKGWTAMTFSLVNIELSRTMQTLAAAISTSQPSSSTPNQDAREQIINDTRQWVDKQLEHCNPVIPEHRLTIKCSHFLLRKLDFITRLQWSLQLHPDKWHQDVITEENLAEALEILQPRLVGEDDMMKQFAWARKAYPQYHIAMYVLWHLCVKPIGPNANKAWMAIDNLFSREICDTQARRFGPKSALLEGLRAKAVSVRDRNQDQDQRGNSTASDATFGSTLAYDHVGIGGETLDFNGAEDLWPDWGTLIQTFQCDSGVFPGATQL
ncbi:putative Transcription factor domain-containing protein [Seiridium cardinale]|uniref:Transcription factor domain-containing protein n=1 Tax=Seiridium cardinale TaxID=138064 RepID=A0ABR2XDU1_9PEZI